MPWSSARSVRGLIGRKRSAIIAVFETRGSATITVFCGLRFDVLAEDRMVVGDVGADEQDHVGLFHILVGAGRAVATEAVL